MEHLYADGQKQSFLVHRIWIESKRIERILVNFVIKAINTTVVLCNLHFRQRKTR